MTVNIENIVLSSASVSYYPGMDIHAGRRLSALLKLGPSKLPFHGSAELFDHVYIQPAAVYCSLPGRELPKETAIGSCRLRLVVLRNLFMIVQATATLRPVERKRFERLRGAVSRGDAEWTEAISSPGQVFIADSKGLELNLSQRIVDFLSDRLDNSQLDLGTIINNARIQIISRMKNLSVSRLLKPRPAYVIDDCCRVAILPGDSNGLKITINEQGVALVQGVIDRQVDLAVAAEDCGIQSVVSLSIARLLNQLANRHEREAQRIIAEIRLGSVEGIRQALLEQISERVDFLIPAIDIWSRIVMRNGADGVVPLTDINREIESLLSRLETCSAVFRDLGSLCAT